MPRQPANGQPQDATFVAHAGVDQPIAQIRFARGDCLLGDFGGASFHAVVDTAETRALQRIEVRAFGILLGELLARIDSGVSDERRAVLEELERRCCQPEVLARPGFTFHRLDLADRDGVARLFADGPGPGAAR